MTGAIHPLVLAGAFVRLEPLGADHVSGLVAAGTEDRATYGWTPVPDTVPDMDAYVAKLIALRDKGTWYPFATRRLADGRVVGATAFLNIEHWDWAEGTGWPDSVEIGSTWLAASAQRTVVNTEAKLLMLRHAFEVWGVQRVQLKTDARNERSRAGIERLGAVFEGILRRYQPASGEVTGTRDTAMYSIVPDEWPAVRARLVASIGPPAA
jgi:RimJ/RimL family protein N-acetyltransferase